jgi:hypothetical protein
MEKAKVLSQILHPKVMDETEQAFIEKMVAAKVLDSLEKHHFHDKFSSAIVCCPDGTKIGHTQNLLRDMYEKNVRKYVQHHLLTHHGGALLLSPDSPIVKVGHTTDVDMIEQIKMSVGMGYNSLITLIHLPCAMARAHKMSPMEMFDAFVKAKKRIKEHLPEVTVACFVQCTIAGKNPEEISESLYFFSKSKYMAWKENNG